MGAPITVTATPVRINDTAFVAVNGPSLSYCIINSENLEINSQFSINIAEYYASNIPFTVRYMIGAPAVEVIFGTYAYIDVYFNETSFFVVHVISLPIQNNPSLVPFVFNIEEEDASVVFNQFGYWLQNSNGNTWVNQPIQDLYIENYNSDNLWALSVGQGGTFELLQF